MSTPSNRIVPPGAGHSGNGADKGVLPAPLAPTIAVRLCARPLRLLMESPGLTVSDLETVDLQERAHASFAFLPRYFRSPGFEPISAGVPSAIFSP